MKPILPPFARHLRLTLLAAAVAGLPLSAGAQDDSALPALQTSGSITWLSGGIGADESDAIKAARDRFALTVTFSGSSGGRAVYLASLPVTVRDAKGNTVLDVVSDGPYLLANLPAGRYEIASKYQGVERKTNATVVAGKPQRVSLAWTNIQRETPAAAPTASTTVTVPGVGTETITNTADAAVAAAGVTTGTSAGVTTSSSGSDTSSDLPEVKTQDGIPYLSGGIGSPETAAIKAAASRYSLSVELSRSQGGKNVFLASVPVTIQDESGTKVLDVITDGPFLLVDLPPGNYQVAANMDGKEKTAPARVTAGGHVKLSFAW